MKTEILTAGDIDRASEIIRAGGLVAVPTETVYGLAANGLDAAAVEKIYAVKGRPAIKPLNLMVHGPEAMERCWTNVPEQARTLASEFWPGPLTIINDSVPEIPEIVRAGGDTVGLRCPDHPLTLELLQKCALPLAAPSANPSGVPSPKTAQEVLAYFDGKIDAVIDGGRCGIGTESSIITLATSPYKILRTGALSPDEIAACLAAGMCIIGITGGSGTGKTTALGVLRGMGAMCIDADELYHELTRTCTQMLGEIAARFGEGVCPGGVLDRKALGEVVFHDAAALGELNAITHKYITREMLRLLRNHAMAGGTLAAIDAVGIFEAGVDKLCSAVIGILAPEDVRVERLLRREGITREYALGRIRAQKSDEYYRQTCTACIVNDGNAEDFAAECEAAFTEVIKNGREERLPRRAFLCPEERI